MGGDQHGQQVNLGPMPSFRKLSVKADLAERIDWIDHVFEKLHGNGSGIRWCFRGRRQLLSTPEIIDYENAGARAQTW